MSDELAGWLLECFAEDEADARQLERDLGRWERERAANGPDGTQGSILASGLRGSAADPDRLLADLAAKRCIVERYRKTLFENVRNERLLDAWVAAGGTEDGDGAIPDDPAARARTTSPFETDGLAIAVKLLALAYADRPGYRDEWRPQ